MKPEFFPSPHLCFWPQLLLLVPHLCPQASRRVCAGAHHPPRVLSRAVNTMPFAPDSKTCYCFLVSPYFPRATLFPDWPSALDISWKGTMWLRLRPGAPAPSLPLTLSQRIISCLRRSAAYVTVSLAGSCEEMRPTGAEGSPPGNMPCLSAGADSTSGTVMHLSYWFLPPSERRVPKWGLEEVTKSLSRA